MLDFNSLEQVTNKLKELKAKKLPKVTVEKFSEICPSFARDIKNATDDEIKKIEEDLAKYYRSEDGNCVFNDYPPNLEWTLIHGEMVDNNTGLAWRYYHYFYINGEREKYSKALQYHPDGFEIEGADE